MNWIKLNVDGARNHAGMISAGGVVRDHSGSWLCGFFANSGCGTVLQAEFWGLLLGLKMSIDAHYQHVLVESDSEVLVKLMNDGVDALHPLKSVINSCQALQRQFQRCEIKHIYREVNKVADVLSKIGLDSEIGMHFMMQPPPQVITILLDDSCETPCFRSIPCI
ncbi:putative ribonuclease H-like domain-containing protein [Rosa chinensis]|uniref:Putative ribonuclease H-like domain-containing protein n=1 Tax=Rosa chinensis TaxID=74649 RepID=A0A2P6Q681_ROSCH|nr:putative ribonuclease H-like domain-containing protein [Rosa chinensis]